MSWEEYMPSKAPFVGAVVVLYEGESQRPGIVSEVDNIDRVSGVAFDRRSGLLNFRNVPRKRGHCSAKIYWMWPEEDAQS